MGTAPENGNSYQTKNANRPTSFYDNYLENGNSKLLAEEEVLSGKEIKFETNPSQAHCLNTTVPQNIAAQSIAGKHTPTRQSLRHSRMIVLNRNGRVPIKYLPAIIRYNKLAKTLAILTTILGGILCLLSIWLIIWTPNIREQDNPYWSVLPIISAGIFGLVFICFCPKKYPGRKLSCWYYSVKFISITTSIAATISAFIVCSLAIINIIMLQTFSCAPPNNLNTSCICKATDNNSTSSDSMFLPQSYQFVDLTCFEVNHIFNIVLMICCAGNGFVGFLQILYLMLHWSSRNNNYHNIVYSKVQNNDVTVYTSDS